MGRMKTKLQAQPVWAASCAICGKRRRNTNHKRDRRQWSDLCYDCWKLMRHIRHPCLFLVTKAKELGKVFVETNSYTKDKWVCEVCNNCPLTKCVYDDILPLEDKRKLYQVYKEQKGA